MCRGSTSLLDSRRRFASAEEGGSWPSVVLNAIRWILAAHHTSLRALTLALGDRPSARNEDRISSSSESLSSSVAAGQQQQRARSLYIICVIVRDRIPPGSGRPLPGANPGRGAAATGGGAAATGRRAAETGCGAATGSHGLRQVLQPGTKLPRRYQLPEPLRKPRAGQLTSSKRSSPCGSRTSVPPEEVRGLRPEWV